MLQYTIQKNYFQKLYNLLSQYNIQRPKPERNLDQFWATEETILQRAVVLGNVKNIVQKSLLFLGDSDLTSIAFCLFFQAQKITVVDIDVRILSFLEGISKEQHFPINLVEHDLRQPFDKKRFKSYDIVFFDPPYTPQAVNTWLTRAIEATLGKGRNQARKKPEVLSSKQYFMCYGYTDRSTERGLKIQQIISSFGLIIQEKLRDFNKYIQAEAIGSKSDLYLLVPTPAVNLRQLDISRSQFYTGQKAKTKAQDLRLVCQWGRSKIFRK